MKRLAFLSMLSFFLASCGDVTYEATNGLLFGDQLYAAEIEEDDLAKHFSLAEESELKLTLIPPAAPLADTSLEPDYCSRLYFTGEIVLLNMTDNPIQGPIDDERCGLEIDDTSVYMLTTVDKEESGAFADIHIEVFGTYTDDWMEIDAFAKIGDVPSWFHVGAMRLNRQWSPEELTVQEEESDEDNEG